MKPLAIQASALSLSAALLFSGCEGMTPGESGLAVGSVAGVTAGLLGSAAGLNAGEAAALGAGVGVLAGAVTYAIAKHEANERQRQIAEANARRSYAAHQTEIRRKNIRYIAVKTSRTQQSKGAASCMVWDTQSKQLVGNNVYDCQKSPSTGSTASFDGHKAQYLGS